MRDSVLRRLTDQPIAARNLAVCEIPRSGEPKELFEKFRISGPLHRKCGKEIAAERIPGVTGFVLLYDEHRPPEGRTTDISES